MIFLPLMLPSRRRPDPSLPIEDVCSNCGRLIKGQRNIFLIDVGLDQWQPLCRGCYVRHREKMKEKGELTMDERFQYLEYLEEVSASDLYEVREKDISYGASWKKRGGTGAFMMLARKWDRLEEICKTKFGYDVIEAVKADMSGKDGSVLAEIRDLRRYLLLVEAEALWECEREKKQQTS